ncbi:hypothetical protein JXA80_08385, partial [bacterium]|nr:hypothetical protein [candidate division CSSED10-310 bacterium]
MRRTSMIHIVGFVCLLAGFPAGWSSLNAADYYVSSESGPGSHTGTMADPFGVIGDAMLVAVAGDAVHITGG